MNIAYCIEGFYNQGGMERILSVKANWLADNAYNVTILVASQKNKPYAFPLNPSIKLVDLNVNVRSFMNSYHESLKKHLIENNYDIVISMGGLEMRFLHKIKDESNKIIELHFAWNRFISSGQTLFAKIKGIVQTLRYIWFLRHYKKIVVLTNYDRKIYERFGIKTINIYNPITLSCADKSNMSIKRVISVGRLDYQKGFDYLIKAWALVEKRHNDWHLDIYGEGCERIKLEALIEKKELQNVTLCGTSSNLGYEYSQSSIYVLSSRTEGLGLVLLEAAIHGLPLLAYDCVAGPKEIIRDDVNGFLIKPVGNIDGLAKRICSLIEDKEMRCRLGQNAYEDSARFNVDSIMQQWCHLFDGTI